MTLRATRLKLLMLTLVDINNFSPNSSDRYICSSLLISNRQSKVAIVTVELDEITVELSFPIE